MNPTRRLSPVNWIHVLAVFLLSLLGVVGDCFLKLASQQSQISFKSKWFILGVLTFALTAFGWVYAFRHIKVASIGVLYSVSTVLLLVLVGVFAFGETLVISEIVGCVLAIVSLFLLGRLA